MDKARKFHAVLQEQIDPEDASWSYVVPNLPNPRTTNAAGLIKSITVTCSATKQMIQLQFQKVPANRVTRAESPEKLVLISFGDFRLRWPSSDPQIPPQLGTARESGNYIAKLLTTGITLNGQTYNFFGHSNSQLKSRSCFLYRGTKQEISAKIEAMGDLSKLKSVGKKAKRIGLLFSSAEMALELSPDRCEDIDDVKKDDYIFTDGCGLISFQLARQLAQKRNIIYRGQRYLPSVFQIRYRGYKGVLTLDRSLSGKIQAQFRQSMKKFKDAKDLSFSVVDFSKPYAFGYLNDEVIILLHSLGISREVLFRKQTEFLTFLENAFNGDSRAAFQFLSFCDRLDVAERLLLDGIETVQETIRGLVNQEFSKMLNKRDEQRCRILIRKSRLVFGVCDPSSKNGALGKLREGECFFRVTLDGDGRARTVVGTEVLVTRNPCLHPGDLQKFRVVDVPEFAHLVDCIVFPTRGKRPSADLMSGGDLDGDKFFVTWDSDIIPKIISEPAEYPGVREPIPLQTITEDDRAEYFARYTNASLGQVKNLYLKWARLGSSQSPQCQQLNRLFSQCVDGNRIRVPQSLQDPPEPPPSAEPFILDALHSDSTQFIEQVRLDNPSHLLDNYPLDGLELLLVRDKLAVSEFELITLTLRWCQKHDASVADFAHLFEFSALSDEQQIWLVNHMPIPANLIRNGLFQSSILRPAELRIFGLDDSRLHWRPVFDSSTDRMGRFMSSLCRSLELFHKKLVILKVDERLALALYIPSQTPRASEVQVDSSVRVFAFPQSQDGDTANYRVMPTKKTYRLYCDESNFQLYQGKRANTWIFLTRSQVDDSAFHTEKKAGDRRRQKQQTIEEGINYDCRISVALDKISRNVQTHVGRVNRNGVLGAEIYVISNRDVKSMAVLDQWLHYVDTEEVLPLFERHEVEYTVPGLRDTDWGEYPPIVTAIVRDENYAQLRLVESIDDLLEILRLTTNYGEMAKLRQIYANLLDFAANNNLLLGQQILASTLLNFLPDALHVIEVYLGSQLWRKSKSSSKGNFDALAPSILRRLVLSANKFHGLVRQPFSSVLRELTQISIQDFVDLCELVALSVRSPETALDVLLECLEPETNRLLVGRPLAVRQLVNAVIGIALDHIDEAAGSQRKEKGSFKLLAAEPQDGFDCVKCPLRIDSPLGKLLRTGDHIRLTATTPPKNAPTQKPYSMDCVVLIAGDGSATFRCLHPPPSYVEECAWGLSHCGSFVTSKTMLDALTAFYGEKESCCRLYGKLVGLPEPTIDLPGVELSFAPHTTLNRSQNDALKAAMTHSLTFLWGPPGTGKTHTIAVILVELMNALSDKRFLVAAPTHNAVDNILRRFISDGGPAKTSAKPLRVSNAVSNTPVLYPSRIFLPLFLQQRATSDAPIITNGVQLSKVSPDLHSFTCDAMVGKEISANMASRRQAQKRIKESRLIFTTCAGAGLGLLRTERFEVVLVDEASQQTEPETLIPLVKGCSRAILVGDHVQLRATVQQNALVIGFDVSLFERHYNLREQPGVAKVMLDTQYRMHRTICSFSSSEFYEGRLQTAVPDAARPVPASQFPWPKDSRLVFVECNTPEDLGKQSKTNQGQVDLCRKICELLTTRPKHGSANSNHANRNGTAERTDASTPPSEIAILTPYARQKSLLQSACPKFEVNSIDGYQGRESDIIVFVTVRCNVHCETGFLKDMRRLNVAMTRAKAGVIVIGHAATLIGTGTGVDGDADIKSRRVWRTLLQKCEVLKEVPDVSKD